MFLILSPLRAARASSRFFSCNCKKKAKLVDRCAVSLLLHPYLQNAILNSAVNFELPDIDILRLPHSVRSIEGLIL